MSKYLLGDGLVHVDFGEPDQVYLVQVTPVPRVVVTDNATQLGVLEDGLEVWLAAVTLDNFVTVKLEGRGPVADSGTVQYRNDWASWEASGGHLHDPPAWPAERLGTIEVTAADDLGTDYQLHNGKSGGDGSEWLVVRRYMPTAPPGASTLRICVHLGAQVETVELPLP